MPEDRRHARVLSMQALCQWDVQQDQSIEVLQDFFSAHAEVVDSIGYGKKIVESYWQQHKKVDGMIQSAAKKWDLSRISLVERNIMRVAVVEMYSDAVPAKVALNEAIEIGADYGGKESPKFINGVLDHIYHVINNEHKEGHG